MAFVFYIFIFAVLCNCIGSKNTTSTEDFQEINLVKSQVDDDNISISTSTAVIYTAENDEASETEDYSTANKNISTALESSNTSEKWIAVKEVTPDSSRYPFFSLESDTSTLSSEANVTYFGEEPGVNSDNSSVVNELTSASLHLNDQEVTTEGTEHSNPDVPNITVSSDEWINKYSLRESRDYKSNSSSEVQEDILILLTSNCSVVNSENVPLNEVFAKVGCIIYLRINISLENGTGDKILSRLEKLTIKLSDFQIVKVHNEAVDGSEHKQQKYNFLLDPETLAFLAVAFSFAFLLLLAIIVFGFRCFKKRRPSLSASPFDVKLSSYTLAKIPRASLTSVDCSRESDCLDDKTESPSVQSRNCGSCESGLDIIPCETFSSNREMKTFGICRSVSGRNADSPSDMYPQHSAIAYENHTFQRYF